MSSPGGLPQRSTTYRVEPPDEKTQQRIEKSRRKRRQDFMRGLIAFIALLLVVLTVVLGFVAANGSHWAEAKDWLAAVLPAETGILGSALGFYFGANKGE